MPNLTELTPEQLFDLNRPMLAKIYARIPLTDLEQTLHEAIVAEADRQSRELRASELAERAERFA